MGRKETVLVVWCGGADSFFFFNNLFFFFGLGFHDGVSHGLSHDKLGDSSIPESWSLHRWKNSWLEWEFKLCDVQSAHRIYLLCMCILICFVFWLLTAKKQNSKAHKTQSHSNRLRVWTLFAQATLARNSRLYYCIINVFNKTMTSKIPRCCWTINCQGVSDLDGQCLGWLVHSACMVKVWERKTSPTVE